MPRTAGNLNDKIDRKLLHQMMWKYRDRMNFMTFKSGELAESLGITPFTMSVILREMTSKGFLKKKGSKYVVTDPAIAAWIPDNDKSQESFF